MVQIPRSNPQQVNLNHEVPVRRLSTDQPNMGDVLSTMGEGLESTGQAIEKALSFAEKTKAKNVLSMKVADIENRAELDTDLTPEKQKKYHSEIDSAIQEASQGISIPANRDEFSSGASADGYLSKIKINNSFLKRSIDNGKAENELLLSDLGNKYSRASQDERITLSLARDKQLDDAVANHYLSREDAAKKKIALTKSWDDAAMLHDVNMDTSTDMEDSFVVQQLRLGSKGYYKDIDPESRDKALGLAQAKVRRNFLMNKMQQTQDWDKNEAQLSVDQIDGKADPAFIKDSILNGSIRRPFGEKMLKKVYELNAEKTKPEAYNEIRMRQLLGEKPAEIISLVLENKDKLTADDAKYLLQKNSAPEDDIDKGKIKYNYENLSAWSREGSLMLESEVTNDFLKRIAKDNATGSRIDDIAVEVQKDTIKKYSPDVATLEDVPNFIVNRKKFMKAFNRKSKLKGEKADITPSVVKPNVVLGTDDNDTFADYQ